ncbi:hypothetical protein ACOMHN_039920 [Nucella lapillus]
MANKSADNSSVLCRYFMHNACQKGSSCAFSHDRDTPPDLICRFYMKGNCAFGDQCRYDHDRNRKNKAKDGALPGKGGLKQTSPPVSSPKAMISPAAVKSISVSSLKESEPIVSRLVPLGKGKHGQAQSQTAATMTTTPSSAGPVSQTKSPEDWVKAKEFVPGQFYTGAVPPTYASAVMTGEDSLREFIAWQEEGEGGLLGAEGGAEATGGGGVGKVPPSYMFCPFMMAKGECRSADTCTYLHGEVCDMCGLAVLHPTDQAQREEHVKDCMEAHEQDMEHSFKVAASREKTCGICMDIILEKDPPNARRFGILENCSHCFCLDCIRKWRSAKQFEKIIVKACPECRVKSDFVTPSQLWVDSPEEKTQLIEGYKNALKEKPCRHFDQGRGDCPFNDSCFYKHALPDGSMAPPKPRRQRRVYNEEEEEVNWLEFTLWDFLERRDLDAALGEDFLIELMNLLAVDVLGADSDSDSDSDF